MKSLLFLIVGALTWQAKGETLKNSYSPDHRFALEQPDDMDCHFIDAHTKEHLGSAIPEEQRDQISRIFIQQVRWNKNSRMAALTLRYGQRLAEVLFFALNSKGEFIALDYTEPDLEKAYFYAGSKWAQFKYLSGFDEYYLGKWDSKNGLAYIMGDMKEGDEENQNKHFLLSVRIKVADRKVLLEKVKRRGVFSDREQKKRFPGL
jgi:hypothetical protein